MNMSTTGCLWKAWARRLIVNMSPYRIEVISEINLGIFITSPIIKTFLLIFLYLYVRSYLFSLVIYFLIKITG